MRSAGEQADFVMTSSFQCSTWASRSRAGNHWAACESPKRTTDVADAASPKTHLVGSVDGWSRWQPSL